MPIVFAQFLKPNQPQSHLMKTPYKIKKKKRCASKIIKKEEVHVKKRGARSRGKINYGNCFCAIFEAHLAAITLEEG